MNKLWKTGLLGLGAVAGLTAAAAVYLVMTFNPNDYKDELVRVVKESKQRTLRLDGDIKLSFFPTIGVNLSKVSLSEANSSQEFAAIGAMRVSLALMPLLRKQVVVDEVAVSGLQATLVKRKDGTTNMDDLLGEDSEVESKQDSRQVKFDIASVSFTDANLDYRDELSGAQYVIKNLVLKTGRIANGVSSAIELSAGIQANQPKLDVAAQLKTRLIFDMDKQQYRLQDLSFELAGTVLDMRDLKVMGSGNVSADLVKSEFGAQKNYLECEWRSSRGKV